MATAEHGCMLPTGRCELLSHSGHVAVIWVAVLLLLGPGQYALLLVQVSDLCHTCQTPTLPASEDGHGDISMVVEVKLISTNKVFTQVVVGMGMEHLFSN